MATNAVQLSGTSCSCRILCRAVDGPGWREMGYDADIRYDADIIQSRVKRELEKLGLEP